MNWKQALVLPLTLALGSCAMDGGTRGSGISTAVEGNVAGIQMTTLSETPRPRSSRLLAALDVFFQIERPARARTEIEGIRVTLEGTDVQGQTDADGRFSLRGDFDGHLTLLFQLPENDDIARIAINVPANGTLTLNNVRLDLPQGEAIAETLDVDFQGIVTETNCDDLTLTMVSVQRAANDTDRYTLRLDTSSVQDAQGNPVACEEIKGGDEATVQGTVNADGTFGHAVVEVGR